jgi:predicted transposase YbfD/YdcC
VQRFSQAARAHWGIENKLHWTLDVCFREVDCRVREGDAAENLSLVRKIALNLLKQETARKIGIAAKRRRAGWDDHYLELVLRGPD